MGGWYRLMTNFKTAKQKQLSLNEFTEHDAELLFLMPLVQVAWAHGAVSPRERQVIFEAARNEGIDERHPLNQRLADWLVYQPSQNFFTKCLRMINERLREMSVKEREWRKSKILNYATRVAASAGEKSLMDTEHRVSAEELRALAKISEMMDRRQNRNALLH